MCGVEIEGYDKLFTACNNVVKEGMVIHTNSRKVRNVRKTNVELILSQHNVSCATCVRSGNCSLQQIAGDLNIYDVPMMKQIPFPKGKMCIRDRQRAAKLLICMPR